MLGVMVAYPWIAFAVAGAFAALWAWRRASGAAVAALMWVVYAAYESLVMMRVLCSGDCNIRVDLLLIYPVLAVVSIVALWRSSRRPSARGAPAP
jgi:hypothetical protein